jgi:hypothetical protein
MKKPEPACQLCAVDLKEGITRKEAEAKIAEVLGRRSDYSPYSDHFKGGTVLYREGDWLLRVTYSEGMAGPYVINGKGIVEHLAPIDETVLSYELLEK